MGQLVEAFEANCQAGYALLRGRADQASLGARTVRGVEARSLTCMGVSEERPATQFTSGSGTSPP
jgi:hypothetical protein